MAETKKKKTAQTRKKAEPAKKAAEPAKKVTEEKAPSRSTGQFASVLLFALGVLLASLTLVKGSSGWHRMHDIILGLFGWAALGQDMGRYRHNCACQLCDTDICRGKAS